MVIRDEKEIARREIDNWPRSFEQAFPEGGSDSDSGPQ
jgi:hypothetical protein